jgi:predicted acyltransferase (DUF342 family)
MATSSPLFAFLLLLLAMLAWMSIPLVPALMELLRPRDAGPLDAVGNDAGSLTYFAESFTARCQREGLLGTMVPPRLSDGSPVLAHSAGQPLPKQRRAIEDLVVLMDSEPLPEGATLGAECLARLTLRGSRGVTYRALLGQRDLILGVDSTVLRWAHARGRFEVGSGSRLYGRATSDRDLVLGTNVQFERLDAHVVRVTDAVTVEAPVYATGAYEIFQMPKNAQEMGPLHWRLDRGLQVPARASLVGSVVSVGSIVVNEGARVTGSLKAHGEVIVRGGAVVLGSITARGRITLEAGARVSGPVISELAIVVEAAIVGNSATRTTVTAPQIRLLPGATIFGAVMAAEEGQTLA